MRQAGIDAIESTVQKTYGWLGNIADELGTPDRHRAYLALRAVLHTLRDRLTVEEAADFGAQLPMLLRGLFYESWRPGAAPKKYRREDFLLHVRAHFADEVDVDPEEIVGAVFSVVSAKVAAGEMEDIKGLLPRDIRELLE